LNYLAHIFLSGNNRQRQVGNFIGDFVKGSHLERFPDEIRFGIKLHRSIDSYTDTHPVVRDAIALLRPEFGRYSGILIDMYFDHFLALHFEKYSDNRSLSLFSINFYYATIRYYSHLPERVQGFIWHFISSNRLCRYSTVNGLQNSLEIMANYKTPAIQPEKTIDFLQHHFPELEERFHAFFPELISYVDGLQSER